LTEAQSATEFRASGEVAEWPIAPVLKTGVPQGTGGSNPPLSAYLKAVELSACNSTAFALSGPRQSFPLAAVLRLSSLPQMNEYQIHILEDLQIGSVIEV
tara:strand:+ start:272 stop:571 length:300 start_codon:yes stop_codon:yes gene_type:complete